MNTDKKDGKNCRLKRDDSMKLVIMLYDGAIGFLNKAVEYAEKEDTQKKNIYLQRANDIIVELDGALDVDAGGEISKNLKLLYSFMNRQLVEAALNNTLKGVKDVMRMMSELRESWQYVNDTAAMAPAA